MLPNSRCCRCELRFGLSARAFAANEQVRNVRIADIKFKASGLRRGKTCLKKIHLLGQLGA